MAYGDRDRARRLSGNNSTTNCSDADIDQYIASADALINGITGRTWTSGDAEYKAIQMASEYFASSFIRSRFEDKDDKAEAHDTFARNILKALMSSGSMLIIKSQGYRTYPLNPDATPYRSISGGNNSVDDSDLS